MMRILWKVLVLLWAVSSVNAAPFVNKKIDFRQPDGSKVPVVVSGDEFYARGETPDGYTVVFGSDGWLRYAQLNADSTDFIGGDIYRSVRSVPRDVKTKHLNLSRNGIKKKVDKARIALAPSAGAGVSPAPSTEIRPAAPISGAVNGLTILVDFADQQATVDRDTIVRFCNGDNSPVNTNACSVKEWFSHVSRGNMLYTNAVTVYLRAPQPFSYYDDANAVFGSRARELIQWALGELNRTGFDFNQLTTSPNGVGGANVPLNVFYAGNNSGKWSFGLWPHQSNLTQVLTYGGKPFCVYQITDIGNDPSIGTFVHENGHMLLGYHDLYPYDGTVTDVVSSYCTMSGGAAFFPKNPVPFNPYFREMSGWVIPRDLSGVTNKTITVTTTNNSDPCVFKSANGEQRVYIDPRNNVAGLGPDAVHNQALPTTGLYIWKVNTQGRNTTLTNAGYEVLLVERDGNSNYGEASDAWKSIPGVAFSDATTPNARFIDGTNSGIDIRNISAAGNQMTFDIGQGSPLVSYTITASVNNAGKGSITPSGSVTVAENGSQTFNFTAVAGNRLDSVKVDGVKVTATNNSYTISNVTKNMAIIGYFNSAPTYTVTASVNDGTKGSVSPNGTVTVTENNSQTFNFTAVAGNRLDSVKVDGVKVTATNNSYTISNVTKSMAIVGYFNTAPTYTVTASVNDGTKGSVSPNGTVTVTENGSQKFDFTALAGSRLDSVKVDGVKVTVANNSYTISNVTKNMAIVGYFGDAGCTDPAWDAAVAYFGGAVVSYNDHSWKAKWWTQGNIPGSVDGTVWEDLGACVSKTYYAITSSVTPANAGTITPNGNTTVESGASQAYQFAANAGYLFDSLTVDGVKVSVSNNSYTVTNVAQNTTVIAHFSAKKWSVVSSVNDGLLGSVSPSGTTLVNNGDSQAFTFTAATESVFDSATVNGTKVTVTNGAFTLSNVLEDKTVVGYFSKAWTVTGTIHGVGTTNPILPQAVAGGSDLPLSFTAGTGEQLDSVYVDGSKVDASTGAYTIAAINKDIAVEVWFSAQLLEVNGSVVGNGSIDQALPMNVEYGTSVELSFTADFGYQLDSVFVNGVKATISNNGITIASVTEATDVVAHFSGIGGATPVLKANNSRKISVTLSSNPVTAEQSQLVFTLPETSNTSKITVLDATGNIVFRTETTNDRVVWNLENRNGVRVSGSFRAIAEITIRDGAKLVWDEIIGIQK